MDKHIRVVKSIKIDHDKITDTSTKTSIRSLVKATLLKTKGGASVASSARSTAMLSL
jgi:hypothetical protein